MADWVLVERADTADDDRDRTRQLATRMGADLRHTEDPSDIDVTLDDLEDGDGLVVCGGDGSLHHAVSAMYRRDAFARVTLAVAGGHRQRPRR